MFMWRFKILVARSSEDILFFKLMKNMEQEDENEPFYNAEQWLQYYKIPSRGFVFGSAIKNRFQIVEDGHIHFCDFETSTDQSIE